MTGEELKALREGLGLSQSQLAGKLGYRPKTISDYERGAKHITQALEKHIRLLKVVLDTKELFDSL